LNIKKRY